MKSHSAFRQTRPRPRQLHAISAAVAALIVANLAHADTAASPPGEASAVELKTVNVIGSRSALRSVADSTTPIDVLSREQLEKLGGATTNLRDALALLAPSFQVDTASNRGFTASARPAGLRGMSGAHVLVLVNGKRRHNSAHPLLTTPIAAGANPVDLDVIPVALIERIEILRDGAAAQYGSDAVAGVVNIVLKKAASGGEVHLQGGQREKFGEGHDGDTLQLRYSQGFALPNQGHLHIGLDWLKQDYTRRAGLSTEQIYPLVNGKPDPRETTVNRRLFSGGLPKIESTLIGYNAVLPIGDNELYSFGTVADRDIKVGQSYRLPNSTSVIPSLVTTPSGVLQPNARFPDVDYQFAAGSRGRDSLWSWDVSTSYGKHRADNGQENSLNASLGLSSPTSFDTFTAIFDQWTSNADARRELDIGLAEPATLAFGAEFREERYRTIARDPLAYANGGYVFPDGPFAGQAAAIGAQAGIFVLPEDEANIRRRVYAGYVDLSAQLLRDWDVAVAGRYEKYSGSAGDVLSGKLSTRYAVSPSFALRGGFSNGFRAPSLTQEGYSSTSRGFIIVNGAVSGLTTGKIATPGSAIGRALGAQPLKPEKSTNLSLGLSWTPNKDFSLTADGYVIHLKNRIAQTSLMSGTAVRNILVANGVNLGAPTDQLVASYYTNAIDTRTQGVDVVADYRRSLGQAGQVALSLGLNYNETKITGVAANPAELANLNLELFDRAARGMITNGYPHSKIILGANWSRGAWNVNLRNTRYGAVDLLTTTGVNDQHYGAKWLTDLEVGYAVTPALTLALGANNLFNVYPDKSTIADRTGAQLYASNSPFGFWGAFYYARASYKF